MRLLAICKTSLDRVNLVKALCARALGRAKGSPVLLNTTRCRLWFVPGRNHIATFARLFFYREYEELPSFSSPRNGVTFDIGANVGFFSLRMALRNPDLRIFALEPDPDNFFWLQKNLVANSIKSVETVQAAAHGTCGEVQFICSARSGDASRIADPQTIPIGKPEGRVIKVNTTTLDEIVKANKVHRIDLIKIDVEGAELDVLLGGKDLALPMTSKIVLEIHSSALLSSVSAFLVSEGFSRELVTPLDPLSEQSIVYFIRSAS